MFKSHIFYAFHTSCHLHRLPGASSLFAGSLTCSSNIQPFRPPPSPLLYQTTSRLLADESQDVDSFPTFATWSGSTRGCPLLRASSRRDADAEAAGIGRERRAGATEGVTWAASFPPSPLTRVKRVTPGFICRTRQKRGAHRAHRTQAAPGNRRVRSRLISAVFQSQCNQCTSYNLSRHSFTPVSTIVCWPAAGGS